VRPSARHPHLGDQRRSRLGTPLVHWRVLLNNNPAPPTDPLGRPIFGIPSGLLGWAIAAIGAVMLVIGIVLHIVATSRRRRVDREYPMPVLWPPNGPPGTAR
jgi:hypothetical protein